LCGAETAVEPSERPSPESEGFDGRLKSPKDRAGDAALLPVDPKLVRETSGRREESTRYGFEDREQLWEAGGLLGSTSSR
jgi:hypothetical protein